MTIDNHTSVGNILPLEQLADLLAPHSIRPWYPNSGRFDFSPDRPVSKRCFLVQADPSIRSELQPVCTLLPSTELVAQATAHHLCSTLRLPLLYLVPHVHWEHELLDHCPQVWEQALALAGVPVKLPGAPEEFPRALPQDDPKELSKGLPGFRGNFRGGADAVVLQPDEQRLGQIIHILLQGLRHADALVLADAPVIVKIHHHQQVWFSSTDPALLPP